jgi:hypothetical protein
MKLESHGGILYRYSSLFRVEAKKLMSIVIVKSDGHGAFISNHFCFTHRKIVLFLKKK